MRLLFLISHNAIAEMPTKANMHGAVIQLFGTMVGNGIFIHAIN